MNRGKTDRTSYFSLTAGGSLLALRLRDRFGGTAHLPRCHSLGCGNCSPFDSISEALPERFRAGDNLVCVMASGIVFRILAPHLTTKQGDPAVIVLDEEGRHVIPLLGGHAAGANSLAREIAAFLGGEASITTSSDVQGLIAPDEAAQLLNACIADRAALRRVAAILVDGKRVCIEAPLDPGIEGYGWVVPGGSLDGYAGRLLVSYAAATGPSASLATPAAEDDPIPTARLIPRCVAAGIGCKRGTGAGEIIAAMKSACAGAGIDPRAVGVLASVDLKEDEPGLAGAAARLGAGLRFYPPGELAALGCPGNDFVRTMVGTPAVSEPAAILAAGEGGRLVAGKARFGQVTVALALMEKRETARADCLESAPRSSEKESVLCRPQSESGFEAGSVWVVGTGAGTAELLTEEAAAAIRAADIIVGYRTYTEQIRPIFPDKEYVAGSMGREIDRCNEALRLAAEGKTVAMVSSGDPGVYGMAGPLLEMANGVPVHIVPGVTAAQIAAARLGAPLMNDYITLSLSDLLTPRDEVIRRAAAAAASDLVVCLYNPTSRKRRPLYEEACGIFLRHRSPDTPAGWVRDAGGPHEEARVVTLGELAGQDTDMRTIIIIGNSKTEIIAGRMVTRRGYREAP